MNEDFEIDFAGVWGCLKYVQNDLEKLDMLINKLENCTTFNGEWEGKASEFFKENVTEGTVNALRKFINCCNQYSKLINDAVKDYMILDRGSASLPFGDVSPSGTTSSTNENQLLNEEEKNESNKENDEAKSSETPKKEEKNESSSKNDAAKTPETAAAKTSSGKSIDVPSSVQNGICSNYTENYGTRGWKYTQKTVNQQWKDKGSKVDGNMCTTDGRYLVAVSPKFGNVGDNIDIKLENGEIIQAKIADVKGDDAESEWGHYMSGSMVDVVEWEITGTSQSELKRNLKEKGWYGKKVDCITNISK